MRMQFVRCRVGSLEKLNPAHSRWLTVRRRVGSLEKYTQSPTRHFRARCRVGRLQRSAPAGIRASRVPDGFAEMPCDGGGEVRVVSNNSIIGIAFYGPKRRRVEFRAGLGLSDCIVYV